ncbi:MAG: methyltransferase domain-containing protein [Mycobacterium sp.]
MTDQLPASEVEIRYPIGLPAHGWRKAVKVGLGRTLLTLRPRHGRLLLEHGDPATFSLIDRLILAGWTSRATPADWPALSALHQRFWAGPGGARFSSDPGIADRFEQWFLREHARPLEFLQRELSTHDCPALCEIGSGNGLALEHLSRELPQIGRFVGVDINAEATRTNARRWQHDDRLGFVAADAVSWIDANAGTDWAYFSNAGVLEYLPEDKVAELYRITAQRGGWWLITEPIYAGYDLASETRSRPNGAEFSFCHNHPHLLAEAGWDIAGQYETEVSGMRFLTICARKTDAARRTIQP